MPSGSKLGLCHPAPVTWMLWVSFKWEWNILPLEFRYPGENSFSHLLKILGQIKSFLGPRSPTLDCYDYVSFAVPLLILICYLPQKSREEITFAYVLHKCDPAHRIAVVLLHVDISTIIGGRARGSICPIKHGTIKYKTQ